MAVPGGAAPAPVEASLPPAQPAASPEVPPPPSSPMPRHRERIWPRRIAATLVALAFIGFVAWGLVLATRPVPQQLQGMVDSEQINAATRAGGRITQMLVHEGDHVDAGQLLATLESPELIAQEAQARAALAGAEAVEQRTVVGRRAQDVAALKATWQSAQAQADLAAVTARRMENLYAEKVISLQRRDDAVAARTSSAQAAAAAREQYLKALAGTREEDRRVAESHVAGAAARLRGAEAFSAETRLVAPAAGTIAARFGHPGEIVMPGIPVYTLVDLADVWVALNVREDQFSAIAVGKELHGSVPALQLHDVAFRIERISPQGDFATWRSTRQSSGYDVKSFAVRARPVERVEGLRPGMSVLFPWPQD